MKKIIFENADAGYYCLDIEKHDERWEITHPTEGYLPNESNQFDMFISRISDDNKSKFIGSKPTFEQCKMILEYLINQNYRYEDLKGEILETI